MMTRIRLKIKLFHLKFLQVKKSYKKFIKKIANNNIINFDRKINRSNELDYQVSIYKNYILININA